MISQAPVAASDHFDGLQGKIAAFIAAAQSVAAGGITWAEFGDLMLALLRLAIETIDTVGSLSGQQKKALVLEAVDSLFEAVADKAVPITLWPLWMLARPAIKSLVLAIAAGAIEQLLPLVRS